MAERHVNFSELQGSNDSLDRMVEADSDESTDSSEEPFASESDDAPVRTKSVMEAAEKVKKSFNQPAHWMIFAGAVLAMCAGMVNTAALLRLNSVVSHMTGHLTALGLRLEGVRVASFNSSVPDVFYHSNGSLMDESYSEHSEAVRRAFLIIVSFTFGSFLCGIVIPHNAVSFGGKSFYGIALEGNSALCILGCILAEFEHTTLSACALACGCGLQNAMCTMHLGAVVRTTHVTGTITDIGSTMGRVAMILLHKKCRPSKLSYVERIELNVELNKLSVLLTIGFSFLLGCFLGAFGYNFLSMRVVLIPAAITGIMGMTYRCFRERMKRWTKKWQVGRLQAEMYQVQTMAAERAERVRISGAGSKNRERRPEEDEEDDDEIESTLEMLHEIQQDMHDMWEERAYDKRAPGSSTSHASAPRSSHASPRRAASCSGISSPAPSGSSPLDRIRTAASASTRPHQYW